LLVEVLHSFSLLNPGSHLVSVNVTAVQGVGGGGILSSTEIIVADPLHWRGNFMGRKCAILQKLSVASADSVIFLLQGYGQSRASLNLRLVVPSRPAGIGVGCSVGTLVLATTQSNSPFCMLDLNLPLSGVSTILFFFLNLRTPQDSLRDKLARMDWM
jgi:hypothetical protein